MGSGEGGDGEEGVKMVMQYMYGLSSKTRWGNLGISCLVGNSWESVLYMLT